MINASVSSMEKNESSSHDFKRSKDNCDEKDVTEQLHNLKIFIGGT